MVKVRNFIRYIVISIRHLILTKGYKMNIAKMLGFHLEQSWTKLFQQEYI